MKSPRVTILVPAHNAAGGIHRCLQAALRSVSGEAEILVVDDGSTDRTAELARAALADWPQAKVVVNPSHLGQAASWNRGLELASGEWVRLANINDLLLPGSTDLLLRETESRPKAVMVCSGTMDAEKPPQPLPPVKMDPGIRVLKSEEALRQLGAQGNCTGGPAATLFRAETVRSQPLRFKADIPFWADFYFAIQAASQGEVVWVDTPTSVSTGGASKTRYTQAGHELVRYFAGSRECAGLIASRLAARGGDKRQGFEFLYQQHADKNTPRLPPVGYGHTWALFKGTGFCTRALIFRARYDFWRALRGLKRLTPLAESSSPRLNPGLSDPSYLHLLSLRQALEPVAASCRGVLVDYGCGAKPYESLFNGVQTYVGVDFDVYGPHDRPLNPDGTLPMEAATVDVVLSSQVLEHVPDVRLYLDECARVLRPGGQFILTTHGIWPYHPGPQNDDYYRWTISGLKREVEASGLEVVEAIGACGGLLCIAQQYLALFDPSGRKPGRLGRYVRALKSLCVNVIFGTLARLAPRWMNAGDVVPICIVISARKRN